MGRNSDDIRAVFVAAIGQADPTAAFVFQEYADLETASDGHFESRFGGEAGGFVAEMIAVWKSVQPFVAGAADFAGIIGLILAARQGAASKDTDRVLAEILSKLEEMDERSET